MLECPKGTKTYDYVAYWNTHSVEGRELCEINNMWICNQY